MERDRHNFFVILDHFLPFHHPLPPNSLKNQNFEKMKKTPGNIIILRMCSINDNYMIYEVWSATNKIFCHFGLFLPFTPPPPPSPPLNNTENQNLEKMKKTPGDIIILQKCTKDHDHMLQCS